MATPLEKDIEKGLGRMVGRHGGMCMKWVCPGWAGVPDRIILLPGGRVIFAETKRPKGSHIEERQKWWAEKLKEMGFDHFFVFTQADIRAVQDAVVRWKALWDKVGPHLGIEENRAFLTGAYLAVAEGKKPHLNGYSAKVSLVDELDGSCSHEA